MAATAACFDLEVPMPGERSRVGREFANEDVWVDGESWGIS
jgi:hypothetical protein